jgi:hypothetical protein
MEDSFAEFSNALAQTKSRVHVWRVDNGSLTEIPDLGTFFTQSVYLVLEVHFQINQKPKNTIYLWCGAFSDPEDEGPVNERIQVLYGLLNRMANIHHEYEGYECHDFYRAFIPYGGLRHRTPGIEYVTNRGFASLFTLCIEPIPHWREVPASLVSLQTGDVCFLRTRSSFILWFGFESPLRVRMRGAELCGAFRFAVGREDETKMVHQGNDDREFVRALSSVAIEPPKRLEIQPDPDQTRKEIYQIVSKGEDLNFVLVALKKEATLAVCQNEYAYILRDHEKVFVWFGKQQPRDAMAIGLVVAVVFMQKMSVSRNVHVQICKSGDKLGPIWDEHSN